MELTADTKKTSSAASLQIDIIQQGRHIGTFLLKRAHPNEFFTSAFELSAEAQEINLSCLTVGVRNKPGLLNDAESIIAGFLSSKRDWKTLSEQVNSFSKDLFWGNREAYYLCFDTFAILLLKALVQTDARVSGKLAANFISLLELPLEKEDDVSKLRSSIEAWQEHLVDSCCDLSYSLNTAKRLIRNIRERTPSVDISGMSSCIVASLKKRISGAPAIGNAALDDLRALLTGEAFTGLSKYGGQYRDSLSKVLSSAESMIAAGELTHASEMILNIDANLFDDADMIDAYFDAVTKAIDTVTADRAVRTIITGITTFNALSSGAAKNVALGVAGIIEKLAVQGSISAGKALIAFIGSEELAFRDEALLNPKVASSIISTGDQDLIMLYTDLVSRIVVPVPRVTSFSQDTWAEVIDPRHYERLSRFFSILGLHNETLSSIIMHLICNLFVTGVYISDDKLFQRDISTYLNSGAMRDNFLPNYILLQKLPVYYNEVAATGKLRDYSTEIDSWGNDPLLYFLRKQVHVNASNNNIRLIEDIIRAWSSANAVVLKGSVPDEVFDKVDSAVLESYSVAMRPLLVSIGAYDGNTINFGKILMVAEGEISRQADAISTSREMQSKIRLICMLYRELKKKYSLLATSASDGGDPLSLLSDLVGRVRRAREVIGSPIKTEAVESLYYKRHIAFGIPSVMGSYHEPKFDALTELYRSEESIRVILEGIIAEIDASRKNFRNDELKKWLRCLSALRDLYTLHDHENFQIDEILAVLQSNALRLSQIVDLLKLWQKELVSMVEFCYRMFHVPLQQVLTAFSSEELPERLTNLARGNGDFLNKAADIVLRDIIGSITGLMELDRLLINIMNALRARVAAGSDDIINLTNTTVLAKDHYLMQDLPDSEIMTLSPFLGSKAKNLFYLSNRGLPVPSSAVFSSAHTDDCETYTKSDPFHLSLRDAIGHIERISEKTLGDPENPLFLSVRSGSYISMPGILSSILYCGMNDATLAGLIKKSGNAILGWDSYRRFIEHYSTVVFGVQQDVFEDLRGAVLAEKPREQGAGEIERIVQAYLKYLSLRGLKIPSDVYEQLMTAVNAIYLSWNRDRAVQFRKAMGVSDHWGTSVMLVEMISGNADGSGASVFFTRARSSLLKGIYGETREEATGDDLVYGKMLNRPLAKTQTGSDQLSLEEMDPDLFSKHKEMAERIETAMGGLPQEVESTYVLDGSGHRSIYILQTKRMEQHYGLATRFDEVCKMEPKIVGRGVGVFGGALSGIATFCPSVEELNKLRQETSRPIILLRRAASTDDVSLMPLINGIITSTGGPTSHASILAQKFNLTAVVGCSDMQINESNNEPYAFMNEHLIREGTEVSIDGSTGLVYLGSCMFTVQSRLV
ncbi:MAG: hypothetical protein HZB62_04070 [Nitrospirae bacterium]|nr:hypothetical protein [Nitrospirota bacterium]